MLRRVSLWLLFVSIGCSLAGGATDKPKPQPKDDYYELYKVLVDTMDQVERNYVKEVDRRELMESAIKGVLGKLDPYSSYIPPDELSRFRATVDSEFGGIGIQIGVEGGQLKILSPLAGTPAYRAGLLAGDRIVAIEGKSTEGINIDDAVARLKGKEGTKITITVIHPGRSDKLEVTLTREKIHVETVLGDRRKADDAWDFMYDAKQRIGYLRVTAFSRDTAAELRRALEQLKGEKMRGLILDLRFNPGGLLSSAIEVSNLFISKGRIVSTKGRNSPERVWDAQKNGAYEGFPMVILVNRYSASASEIVSACLQDHKRAVVVGERTWGKGSVQNVVELENGRSALKLTTASYRRPSGKNIHRFEDAKEADEWGVTPDKGFDLKLGDSEMVNLLEDRRRRDVLQPHDPPEGEPEAEKKPEAKANGNGKATEPPAPKTNGKPPAEKPPAEKPAAKDKPGTGLDEPPFVDRQLQMAVKYLTGQLARSK
jgi:carboxyl-terminal processing protease